MKLFHILFLALKAFPIPSLADIQWPLYDQQCRDDAGTTYGDDAEIYGPNGYYHDNSAATPILQDGKCPGPLEQACKDRPTEKAAFMEGPIDCGDQGWYCRIMPDENWPSINLIGDLNFGHCNTTDGFDDAGYDGDGHCHGSSVDNTYYWWVRDHFFRQYNGRLRCCCGWYEGASDTPMYGRRIANRCDYRRQLTETEDPSECRDANEDHNLGFDDIGCDPSFRASQLNKPIPEDDGICWEVARFGYSDSNGGDDDNGEGDDTIIENDDEPVEEDDEVEADDENENDDEPVEEDDEVETDDEPVDEDDEVEADDENDDEPVEEDDEVESDDENDDEPVEEDDEVEADDENDDEVEADDENGEDDVVATCTDSTLRFKFNLDGNNVSRNCSWVRKKATKKRCAFSGVSAMCPNTCGACENCDDTTSRFRINWNGDMISRGCTWVGNKATRKRCAIVGVAEVCRSTCDACSNANPP